MAIFAFCFFCFSPLCLYAAGTSGFQFLSIGNGAQAEGMGEAQAALAEGANAIYWNPAGLGLARFNELSVTQLQYVSDATQQYAAFALPMKKGRAGAFGFSATRFAVTDIETRDAQSARIGTTKEDDRALQISYGARLGGGDTDWSGFFVGAGVKQIASDLAGVSANAVGFDLGAQYRPGSGMAQRMGEWTRRLSLGLAAINLGKGATYDRETTDLPRENRAGLGYTHFLWGDALNLEGDAVFLNDGSVRLSEGAEFWIRNTFALRVGFVGDQKAGSGLRAGAGFRFQTIELNYAWTGFGDTLGNAHRFSLNWRFGRDAQAATNGLKSELLKFHLSEAQDHLTSGAYHEAVIEANHALDIDPRNPQALQLLIEAGEKMKTVDPLPEPKKEDGPANEGSAKDGAAE